MFALDATNLVVSKNHDISKIVVFKFLCRQEPSQLQLGIFADTLIFCIDNPLFEKDRILVFASIGATRGA